MNTTLRQAQCVGVMVAALTMPAWLGGQEPTGTTPETKEHPVKTQNAQPAPHVGLGKGAPGAAQE